MPECMGTAAFARNDLACCTCPKNSEHIAAAIAYHKEQIDKLEMMRDYRP